MRAIALRSVLAICAALALPIAFLLASGSSPGDGPALRLSAEQAMPGAALTVSLSEGDGSFTSFVGGSLERRGDDGGWVQAFVWGEDGSIVPAELGPALSGLRLDLPSSEALLLPDGLEPGSYRVVKLFRPLAGAATTPSQTATATLEVKP